jgi:hypothetical protein
MDRPEGRAAAALLAARDRFLLNIGWRTPRIDGRGMILHLSDTPSCLYGFLRRTIRVIRPTWIVHTGDLADEIKLERYPHCRGDYLRRVALLFRLLGESSAECFLFLGNHDSAECLRELEGGKVRVCPGRAETFELGGLRLRAGHDARDVLTEPAPVNLFGHDLHRRSGEDGEGRLYLNGLEGVHLISAASGTVTRLPYPWGTDDARLLRYRSRL